MKYLRNPKNGKIIATDNTEYWKDCEKLTVSEGKKAYRAQACEELRQIIKLCNTVYTRLHHVSRSGMRRSISLYIVQDGAIRDITYLAAIAMDDKRANDGGIIVNGCGMDMGFHLVYNLGWNLYPKGSDCGRQNKPDTDGGYSLRQSWI